MNKTRQNGSTNQTKHWRKMGLEKQYNKLVKKERKQTSMRQRKKKVEKKIGEKVVKQGPGLVGINFVNAKNQNHRNQN